MFHLIRVYTASFCFLALTTMFLAELHGVRDDRHLNITISVLQHFFIMAMASFLLSESFATFRAITAGIIGGKTWSYVCISLGLPMLALGMSMHVYGSDYGTDPRAFLGWNNETKWLFFYALLPMTLVSLT